MENRSKPVKLLTGGNPQIAKADGDAPVQAYIAAMPGWKRDVGRRLDTLIVRTVPGVRKAVKWNSPFYGIEGEGWFLSFHTFTNYVKVTFFQGTSCDPFHPAARPRTRAGSTSARMISTRRRWRRGSGRRPPCPAGVSHRLRVPSLYQRRADAQPGEHIIGESPIFGLRIFYGIDFDADIALITDVVADARTAA